MRNMWRLSDTRNLTKSKFRLPLSSVQPCPTLGFDHTSSLLLVGSYIMKPNMEFIEPLQTRLVLVGSCTAHSQFMDFRLRALGLQ